MELKEFVKGVISDITESIVECNKLGNGVIKYLKPAEEKGMIKCVSENPEHPAFDVPLKDILKIYLVKGHIEKCAI